MVKVLSFLTTLCFCSSHTSAFLGHQRGNNNIFHPKKISSSKTIPTALIISLPSHSSNDINESNTKQELFQTIILPELKPKPQTNIPSKVTTLRKRMKKISSVTFIIVAQLLSRPNKALATHGNHKILPLVHSSSSNNVKNDDFIIQQVAFTNKRIKNQEESTVTQGGKTSKSKAQQITIGLLGGTMAGAMIGGSKLTIQRKRKNKQEEDSTTTTVVEGNKVLFEDIISTSSKDEKEDIKSSSTFSDNDEEFNALLEQIKKANAYVYGEDDDVIVSQEKESDIKSDEKDSNKLEEKDINKITSSFTPVKEEEITTTTSIDIKDEITQKEKEEIVESEINYDEIMSFNIGSTVDDNENKENDKENTLLIEDDDSTAISSSVETIESAATKEEDVSVDATTPIVWGIANKTLADIVSEKKETDLVTPKDDIEETTLEKTTMEQVSNTVNDDEEEPNEEESISMETKETTTDIVNEEETNEITSKDVVEEESSIEKIISDLLSDIGTDNTEKIKSILNEATESMNATNINDKVTKEEIIVEELATQEKEEENNEEEPIELVSEIDNDDELLLDLVPETEEESSVIVETTTLSNATVAVDVTEQDAEIKEEMIVEEIAKNLKHEEEQEQKQDIDDCENIYFLTEKEKLAVKSLDSVNTTESNFNNTISNVE